MKLLKSKQGIVPIVGIIMAAVGAIIFLTVLWPAFSALLMGTQTQAQCNWNLFIATLVSEGSLGFKEIDPGCKAEYITIDSELLKKYFTLAKKRITKYCPGVGMVGKAATTTEQYYTEAGKDFCAQQQVGYDELNEWALDNIISKKMQECADKVWRGKLDFFSRYKVSGNRVYCVVCSVISFSDDMPSTLRDKEAITTLYDLMQAEPYYKTTYYDYVFEGMTKKLNESEMQYTTKVPIAITYIHTKKSVLRQVWEALPTAIIVGESAAVGTVFLPFAGPVVAPAAAIIGGYYAYSTDDDLRQILIQPYESLVQPIDKRGAGCTDIIA